MQDRRSLHARAAVLVLCLSTLGLIAHLSSLSVASAIAGKAKPKAKANPLVIGQGRSALPTAVNEMRDAIIAAARTGNLDELMIPIQWNELPPELGDLSVKDTLTQWKKRSPDGSGREWLAKLINLLEAPYAVLRMGPDIENNKIYIWPAFSEIPLVQLSPALHVEFLRLLPTREVARMIAQGHYDGHGLAIGADGTWHVFKKVSRATVSSK